MFNIDIAVEKKKDVADGSSFVEGATALRGESQQQFGTCRGLDTADDMAVVIQFTMVAKYVLY